MVTTPVGSGGSSSSGSSSGSGAKWLAKFLYDNGLRGRELAYAWSLAMRESGGRPTIDNAGLNPNGSIDYGLFQINNKAHADKLRRRGWTVEDLRDPKKNLEIFLEISRNGKDYSAWGIANPDGSVTGWAAHVQRTSPSDFARFRAGFDSQMRQWGERYAGRYGGTSATDGASSAATDTAARMGREESLRETNSSAWAESHNSSTAIDWALNEMNSAQKDYSGLCDHFVGRAYGYAHSGFATAAAHWAASPGKRKDGVPPAGALVFWTGGRTGAGHVAISLGGGMIASTDILRSGKVDVVSIEYLNARWGNLQYQGWANPYFYGQRIKPAGTDAELNARINYAARESDSYSSGDSTTGATVPSVTSDSGGDSGSSTGSDSGGDSGGDTRAAAKPADVNSDGKVDNLDYAQMARDWGLAWAFIKSDKDLMDIVRQAVENEWDSVRFENALHNTKWWRTHEAAWRQIEALRLTDPASYGSRIKDEANRAKAYAAQMGVSISQEKANEIAYKALHYGWTDYDYKKYLAPMLQPGATGFYMGEAGDNEEQLRQMAYRNGVTMNDDFYRKAVQTIADGSRQMGDWEDYIRKQAASMFPVYADQLLQGGVDVIDLAQPYMSRMSAILEIDPGALRLDDPTLRQAMTGANAEGKPESMGLWDFENLLRQDPRWMKTKNAKNQFDSTARTILETFGFMG